MKYSNNQQKFATYCVVIFATIFMATTVMAAGPVDVAGSSFTWWPTRWRWPLTPTSSAPWSLASARSYWDPITRMQIGAVLDRVDEIGNERSRTKPTTFSTSDTAAKPNTPLSATNIKANGVNTNGINTVKPTIVEQQPQPQPQQPARPSITQPQQQQQKPIQSAEFRPQGRTVLGHRGVGVMDAPTDGEPVIQQQPQAQQPKPMQPSAPSASTFLHSRNTVKNTLGQADALWTWTPLTDTIEDRVTGMFTIIIELPGVLLSDISLNLHGDLLHVSALKRAYHPSLPVEKLETSANGQVVYRSKEIDEGVFRRSFRLAPDRDFRRISAVFQDGMLSVSVPMFVADAPTLESRPIEVFGA